MNGSIHLTISIGNGWNVEWPPPPVYHETYTIEPDGSVTMEVTEYEFHGIGWPLELINQYTEYHICLKPNYAK